MTHGTHGAWAGAQEASADRAQIVSFPSTIPAMPASWGLNRPYLGRVRWLAGDADVICTNCSRCEFAVYGGIGIPPRNLATIGDDVWQSFEVYIPPGTVFNTGFNHLMQWHGNDRLITVGPIISLSINRGVTPNQFQSWVWGGATNASRVSNHFNLGPYKTGWSRFLYHIIWGATNSTGFIDVWIDDFSGAPDAQATHAVSGGRAPGAPNCFAAAEYDDGMYIKQGIYSGRRTSSIDLYFGGHRLASTRAEVGGIIVVPNTSTDTFAATAHGFANGTTVQFDVAGGSLPSPLLVATNYYVISTAANSFQVANSSGGTAVNLTTAGSGTIFVTPTSVSVPPPVPPVPPGGTPGGPGAQTGPDADFYGNNTLASTSAWAEASSDRKRGILVNWPAEKDATKIVAYLDGNATSSGAAPSTVGQYYLSEAEKTAIRTSSSAGGNAWAITARANIIALANTALSHNFNPPPGTSASGSNWRVAIYDAGLSDGHAVLNLAKAYMLTGTASYANAARAGILEWATTYNPPSPVNSIGHYVAEPVGFMLKAFMAYTLIVDTFTSAQQQQIRTWAGHFVGHAKTQQLGAVAKSQTDTAGPWGNGIQWSRALGCWAGAIAGDSTIWAWNRDAPGTAIPYGWASLIGGVMEATGRMRDVVIRNSLSYGGFALHPLLLIADLHAHVRPAGVDGMALWNTTTNGRSLKLSSDYFAPYLSGTADPYASINPTDALANNVREYRAMTELAAKVYPSDTALQTVVSYPTAGSRAGNLDGHITGYNALSGGITYAPGSGTTASTTQAARMALYNHSTGALIAQTEEKTIDSGEIAAWVPFSFGSAPRPAAGTDTKAVLHTGSGGVIRYGYDALTSGGYSANDTYTDGAAASTTSWTTTNEEAAIYVGWTTPAASGLAYDATSRGEATASSLTWSHTCTGTNRALIVGVSLRNNASQTISSVTYNAVALTLIGTVANGTSVRTALYRLIAPATGANNVVVTLSASAQVEGSAVSFTGAHQTTLTGTAVTASGATGAPSVAVTDSSATEIIVDTVALAWATGRTLSAVGVGQTSRQNDDLNDASTGVILGTSTQPGATGSQVMDWTQATSGGGGSTTVAFRAIGAKSEATSGNITLVKPTGTVDDDIMLMEVASWDNVPLSLPAGWTVVDQTNANANFRVTLAWKRASSEGTSYVVTHAAGSDILGYISSWSGCKTSGSPVNTHSQNNSGSTTSTSITFSAITPSVANCMLVAIGVEHEDDGSFSGVPSGTNPVFVNAGAIAHQPSGNNDLRLGTWYGTKTDTTTSGARTETITAAARWLGLLVALEPQVGGTGLDGAWASAAVSIRPSTAAAGDTQPPSLVSASVSDTTLTLNYNELLDSASTPDADSFSVLVNNLANVVTAVVVSNFTVTLTLTDAVVVGDIVLLSYLISPPGVGALVPLDTLFPSDVLTTTTEGDPIQDLAGNDAATLTLIPVTNVTADTVAPVLQTAVIVDDVLILTYNEDLDTGSVPSTSDFYVAVNSITVAIDFVEIASSEAAQDPAAVSLILGTPVLFGDTVTVTYVPAANPIQDVAGNDAAALTEQAVTNNTSAIPGTPDGLLGWRPVTTESAIWEPIGASEEVGV